MHLTVIGASGRTGDPLVEQAIERGHDVTAFVRERSRLAHPDHERLSVVEGDAYTGEGLAEAVAGADAVLSVLGQSESGPDDLLAVAGERVLAAMAEAGVDRYVTLVGAGVRLPDEPVPLRGKVMGALLKLLSGAVLRDAEAHVEAVRESDLRWTVVRAPRLGEGERAGTYRVGEDVEPGFQAVPRADVAEFVLDVVENDSYVRALPKIAAE